jgi:four helix bundle protein
MGNGELWTAPHLFPKRELRMRNIELERRTKKFAVRVVKIFGMLPKIAEAQILGKQALRSGTSVAANYREASRGRSQRELKSKLGQVEQELDETMLWFELLMEAGIVKTTRLMPLYSEAEELLKIMVASIKTLKRRK